MPLKEKIHDAFRVIAHIRHIFKLSKSTFFPLMFTILSIIAINKLSKFEKLGKKERTLFKPIPGNR